MNATLSLICDYELGGRELYSVKWSHDDRGFYRFFPRLEEPRQVFPSSALSVELEQSDHRSVRLSSVSLLSSGVMRCEVTTEGPMFLTVAEDSLLTVVEPPSLSLVQTGDSLVLDCQPGRSGSPSSVWPSQSNSSSKTTFYFNGSPVRAEKKSRSLLYSLDTTNQHLQVVNISCSQNINNFQIKSKQKSVRLEGQLSSSHRPKISVFVFLCLFMSVKVSK